MEDILKNELFIEHLSKLLTSVGEAGNCPQGHPEAPPLKEQPQVSSLENQMQSTQENNVSINETPQICGNLEQISFDIKQAFEISKKIGSEKENWAQKTRASNSRDMFDTNTSNMQRTTNSKTITSRKKQFINAVIQKLHLNIKRKKQSRSKKQAKGARRTMHFPQKDLLRKVSLGLSEREYFYLENDLRVMTEQRKMNLQFLGKVLGRKSDYYIMFGGHGVGLHGGSSRTPSLKEQQQSIEPEGVGLNRFEVWVARHNRMVGGRSRRNPSVHARQQVPVAALPILEEAAERVPGNGGVLAVRQEGVHREAGLEGVAVRLPHDRGRVPQVPGAPDPDRVPADAAGALRVRGGGARHPPSRR